MIWMLFLVGAAALASNACSDDKPSGEAVAGDGGIKKSNEPPQWGKNPDRFVREGENLSFPLHATDPTNDRLIYSSSGLPPGASLSASGLFSWRPDYDQSGDYTIPVEVSDGVTSVGSELTVHVANTNRSPVMTPVAESTVPEGELLNLEISATDPDGDPVTLGSGPLPSGALFDPARGLLAWTPDFDQAGDYSVEFTASDGEAVSTEVASIHVENVNRAPVLDPIADQTANEGDLLSLVISGSDPDGDPLTYSRTSLPANAILNSSTGVFEWRPSFTQGGVYVGTFSVSDGDLAASQDVTIVVNNVPQPPVLAAIGDQTVDERETLLLSLSASDVDGDSLSFSATGLPVGAVLTTSGDFSWTPTSLQAGSYGVTFRVTDGLFEDSEAITIVVNNVVSIERVSVDESGGQLGGESYGASVSADGRFVAFYSEDTDLAWRLIGCTFGVSNVFLRDRESGLTELITVSASGVCDASGPNHPPSVSGDGQFVAFASDATNLVSGDTNGVEDVFVRDRASALTSRVSVSSAGIQANDLSFGGHVSSDGGFVSFSSQASNLVSGDTNGTTDVFVRDLRSGTTERVSVNSSEVQGNSFSQLSAISADGTLVAFQSLATNLFMPDTNSSWDLFVRNRASGETERVSVASDGTLGDGDSVGATISADGRFVAFRSSSTNLVAGDTNGVDDIFVHDRDTGVTERVSVSSDGTQANDRSDASFISADGRFVAFYSRASNLVAGDTNAWEDIFIHDRSTGVTARVNVGPSGAQTDDLLASAPQISADNRFGLFSALSDAFVSGDTNGDFDVFLVGLDSFFSF